METKSSYWLEPRRYSTDADLFPRKWWRSGSRSHVTHQRCDQPVGPVSVVQASISAGDHQWPYVLGV
jgi:hypothetical protein